MPSKVSEIISLIEHPTKPGRVTVAGKPSDTLHPRTEQSILKQAQIKRRP